MEAVRDIFVKGGPVMWPLLACSLLALTMIIERLIFWWRENRHHDEARLEDIMALTERGDYDIARARAEPCRGSCIRMIHAGLAHREHGLSEAVEIEAGNQVARMKQGMAVLDTCITMAPMLGILGTVTGIIRCFDLLGSAGIQDPRAATTGLAEALITTAAGLIIALVTLVPFNYFVTRVQDETRRLERIATQFEGVYRKSQSGRKD